MTRREVFVNVIRVGLLDRLALRWQERDVDKPYSAEASGRIDRRLVEREGKK